MKHGRETNIVLISLMGFYSLRIRIYHHDTFLTNENRIGSFYEAAGRDNSVVWSADYDILKW